MGMFDSFYSAGFEFQTKAFSCRLAKYHVGDSLLSEISRTEPLDFQVEIYGNPEGKWVETYATVRDGYVTAVGDSRDDLLPLRSLHGGWV